MIDKQLVMLLDVVRLVETSVTAPVTSVAA
jgi:hypothetical protein